MGKNAAKSDEKCSKCHHRAYSVTASLPSKFVVSKSFQMFFKEHLLRAPRLHLNDQKYSNIMKYHYNLK